MDLLSISLFLSLLLGLLLAGFLFAFAVVVMPGIRSLGDREFLRAFQAMDRVIQNRQPLFLLVWLGAPFALLTSAALAFAHLDSTNCSWLIAAAALHLLGVQLPTVTINVPLNNQLQRQDVAAMTAGELHTVRLTFETRWVRWNTIRTTLAILATIPVFVVVARV